jgi:hypothetical protein
MAVVALRKLLHCCVYILWLQEGWPAAGPLVLQKALALLAVAVPLVPAAQKGIYFLLQAMVWAVL